MINNSKSLVENDSLEVGELVKVGDVKEDVVAVYMVVKLEDQVGELEDDVVDVTLVLVVEDDSVVTGSERTFKRSLILFSHVCVSYTCLDITLSS